MFGGPSLIANDNDADDGDKGGALRGGGVESGDLEVGLLPEVLLLWLPGIGISLREGSWDGRVDAGIGRLVAEVETDKWRTLGGAFKSHLKRGGYTSDDHISGKPNIKFSHSHSLQVACPLALTLLIC